MAPKTASKAPAASPTPAPVAAPTASSTPAQTPPAVAGEGQSGDSTAAEGVALTTGDTSAGPTSGEATAIADGALSDRVFPDVPESDRAQGGSDPAKPIELSYQVCSVPIRHDGEYYPVGSTVRMTYADAARLGPLVILVAGASDED